MTLLTNGRPDFGKKNQSSVIAGTKDVITPLTAVQLPSNIISKSFELVIKAKSGNTGTIYVADNEADAKAGGHADAYELSAGETISYRVTNTNILWIDAENAGEGVTFTVEG